MAVNKNKKASYEKHLEAISKVASTITSDLYLNDILKLIVTVTAEVMDSKICSLMLIDDKTGELVLKATQSMSEAYNKKPNLRVGEGIAGKVARTNKPIAIYNLDEETEYISKNIAIKEGLKSLLSVPLSFKGKVIGVLNSYTSHTHKFSREEISVLTAVANQAAI
ncbi:MAG: GAF domain-containing protein, partial [Candidatus Omnitrophota bacterium]